MKDAFKIVATVVAIWGSAVFFSNLFYSFGISSNWVAGLIALAAVLLTVFVLSNKEVEEAEEES